MLLSHTAKMFHTTGSVLCHSGVGFLQYFGHFFPIHKGNGLNQMVPGGEAAQIGVQLQPFYHHLVQRWYRSITCFDIIKNISLNL